MNNSSAIIIGAGIVGLATARSLAIRGYSVTIFERSERAVGASIRNFGMIWPIGQPSGELHDRAMASRNIWKEICKEAKIWHEETGSLHLAYHDDELQVLTEFADIERSKRNCCLLSPVETIKKSDAVNRDGLKGSLWSGEEMIIEPRNALAQVAAYLAEKYDVSFHWNTVITHIEHSIVFAGMESWEADHIYVCSGSDLETLYPEIYKNSSITKCKLQMMRLASQPEDWRIGPSLCGSLSLIHYAGFKVAPSLNILKSRYEEEFFEYLDWGIHVMVSQNGEGELTIGDSHEYGLTHDPFDKDFINQMILAYLSKFAVIKDWKVIQNWNGIYSKMTNGETCFVHEAEPGVTIINGMGGAGMTLSFGLAEDVVSRKIDN